MKVAAIYRVFDGEEHLEKSIESIKEFATPYAIVSTIGFGGDYYEGGLKEVKRLNIPYQLANSPKEIHQRVQGVNWVKSKGFTHYTLIDCDEVYDDYSKVIDCGNHNPNFSIVVPCKTYFKDWVIEGWDFTAICALAPVSHLPSVYNYAYFKQRIDPTRAVRSEGIEIADTFVHHYSWVRDNIERKINNSTAKTNILKSGLINLYQQNERPLGVLPIFAKCVIEKDEWIRKGFIL
jgi:hypothetical protein